MSAQSGRSGQSLMPLLLRGDARALPLPDESVDLIVASPPYHGLGSYTDGGEHHCGRIGGRIGEEPAAGEYLDTLLGATREWKRVLRPAGSIWLHMADRYADGHADDGLAGHGDRLAGAPLSQGAGNSYPRVEIDAPATSLMLLPERYRVRCVDELGLIARAVVIWSEPIGLPEPVTDRVRRDHEDRVHLTKSPRYYSAVDEIRERANRQRGRSWGERKAAGVTWTPGVGTRRTHLAHQTVPNSEMAPHALGKLPGSVWTIPSQPLHVPAHLGVDPVAALPMQLPRRIILGWSPRQVCTACGHGRRPIIRVQREPGWTRHTIGSGGQRNPGEAVGQPVTTTAVHTITGYACACPDTTGTRAPTTPGVVLDPCVGAGTTVLVASVLGRRGIGIDIGIDRSRDHPRLARWRCSDPTQRARAAQVTAAWPQPQPRPRAQRRGAATRARRPTAHQRPHHHHAPDRSAETPRPARAAA